MKKVFSMLLALVMAFSIISFTAFAADDEKVPDQEAPDGFADNAVQLPKKDVTVIKEKEEFTPAELTPEMFEQIFGALEQKEGINIYIDGQIVIFPDAKPQIIQDRTLVPVRMVSEQLGADVKYDGSNNQDKAIIKTNDLSLELIAGDNIAKVNGEDYKLDVPAMMIQNRIMVPFRFIFEKFGLDVNYQELQNDDGSMASIILATTKNY